MWVDHIATKIQIPSRRSNNVSNIDCVMGMLVKGDPICWRPKWCFSLPGDRGAGIISPPTACTTPGTFTGWWILVRIVNLSKRRPVWQSCLLFDHRERPVSPLCERQIGEHMSVGHEWVFGMYGTKTRKLLRWEVHGIGCFRGFFVEPGPHVRWICKVGRVIQAINKRIYELVKVFVFPIYSRSKNCPNVSPFLTNLHQSNPNPKPSLWKKSG